MIQAFMNGSSRGLAEIDRRSGDAELPRLFSADSKRSSTGDHVFKALVTFFAFFSLCAVLRADFVAYNDHEPGAETHPNTTTYQANGTDSGPLKDIDTGEDLPVVLTTTGVGVNYAQLTDFPAEGTDAGNAFLGYVDFAPGRPHSLELSGADTYTHEFSNMDPSRRYDFTGTAVRGNDGYTGRWTLVTLEGAASYIAAHSEGAGVVLDGLNPNQVAIWTGENHHDDQGFVARWKEIDPGPDGVIRVISQQYIGPIPGDIPTDSKGYALVAVRLIEQIVEGRPEVVNLPATGISAYTASIGGEVTDPGLDTPDITVYYGTSDGGRVPDNWDHAVELGPKDSVFSTELSGLLPGTGYFFRCYAHNSVAGNWADSSESFETPVMAPRVQVAGVESTSAFSARVSGLVEDTGGEMPEVWVYWGPSDGGETQSAWAHSASTGFQDGGITAELTGLSPETSYFFNFYAANSAGGDWGDASGSLTTSSLNPPQVMIQPVASISDRSATITGSIPDTGGDAPTVTLFFGPTDGGSNPASWMASVELGVFDGGFSGVIAPLQPLTYYYVRARAGNAAGEEWSGVEAFQTREEMVVSIVINEVHYNTVDPTSQSEFIELFNASDVEMNLNGWRISGAVDYTFSEPVTLAPGDFLVITEDLLDFRRRFSTNAYDEWERGDRLDNQGERIVLRDNLDDVVDEVTYQEGFPWPTAANGAGPSMELIHPLMDNDLGGSWRSSNGDPTPGVQNSVYSESAPPLLRQVGHSPKQPNSQDSVTITAKATDQDGMADMSLEYQVVHPGAYIEIGTSAYDTQWTRVSMRDDGTGGDAVAGDDVFTAVLPASTHDHRDLVRYRISAEDSLGHSVQVPYPDDEQANFGYFVYDGIPAWTGSARPGVTDPVTYGEDLLGSIPVYHLITTRKSHVDAMHIPNSGTGEYWGSDYPWRGTIVYNGEVYDHVRFRARGGVWRYSMGKNMWKFDFLRSHDFQAHDDYGKPYDTKWKKLNFSALIQQGNFLQRGEQGLFEGAGFRLHNLADNAAPKTHYVHFRVVESEDENGLDTSQFDSDFQGLYMVIEQPDGRFLNEHGLPDGNFYKMEGGTGELNNQGPTQPTDKSDLNAFMAYQSQTMPVEWWRANLDLDQYYSWRSIMEAIHDYDNHAGKNYFYFHDPETELWSVINWDLDLTWTTTYNGGGGRGPLNDYVFRHPELVIEYHNRMREIRDLLFNSEQTGMLLDEIARVVYTPGQPSFVDADRAMWDYNPIMVSNYVNWDKAGYGRFYESAPGRSFGGMVAKLKSYIQTRGSWIDSNVLSDDHLVPAKPSITSFTAGFPVDDLRFETGAFMSPAGAGFAAMEWRLAEVTDPLAAGFNPAEPRKYEITSTWESGEISEYAPQILIPENSVKFDQLYRVRVRMKDSNGRWSHWSDPLQFSPGLPTNWTQLVQDLKITELMYHPDASLEDQLAGFDEDDFEFIELFNRGDTTLDVHALRFTKGIDFDFASGSITELEPGAYALVVRDISAFERRYGTGLPIAGEYLWATGDERFANGGERVKLSYGAGNSLIEFVYDDQFPWPWEADGNGYSLSLARPMADDDYNLASSWQASLSPGGSPGRADESDYQQWLETHFSEEELEDPAISGEDADPDGDGLGNKAEWKCGTDPRDPDSVFDISAGTFIPDSGYLIQFPVVSGKMYQVQYTDSLKTGIWQDLPGGGYAALEDGQAEILDATAPGSWMRFYRVLLVE
jgi:hypothetical protein